MKKITKLEFVNYKAFYGEGIQNAIEIPYNKNVLIYGENGSGKSSIYEGLKQFFNSTDEDIIISKHISVPKNIVVDADKTEESEVAVKITFTNENNIEEENIFGRPNYAPLNTFTFLSETNKLNSFFSYRELLKTYLMDNLRDKSEFRKKFAQLITETILAKSRNSATQNLYSKDLEDLDLPKVGTKWKNSLLEKFKKGLINDIRKINLILNEILEYFDDNLKIEIQLVLSELSWFKFNEKKNRDGYFPEIEIELKVELFCKDLNTDEENHLTVLNEARLSSLALSIYLASLINTPQDNLDYKILFLDDIFIGLDMNNRLPLLKILTEFKKPIFEQSISEDGKIIEKIKLLDGKPMYETEPFFNNYQIFITTYDRHWFEVSKNWFDGNSKGRNVRFWKK